VLKNIVSGSRESERLFKKFGVVSVPTFIIKGPGFPQNIGLRGVQSEKTLHKYLDIALGLRRVEESSSAPGFFSKVKAFFGLS